MPAGLGWHVYPAARATDRCLERALSASARYLEGGRRGSAFRRTGSLIGGRLVGQNRAIVANPMEKRAPVRGGVDVARGR